ncbi:MULTISPECIES: M28 family peptidase [Sphingobium]|jgi:carboxypeptidase Q|uniref:M28 family peptidase n=1 Tax=Sphingobium TaxID=165695 RepID=UPI000C3BE3F1|nr:MULTISPECIES: M28 family peptidase [Sphingobium]MBS47240.1 peptidase M28 family protein [Sphingobium sp.]MCC4257918.1 M28 family peptidase [Sphingobium lactosutens]MEC9018249.1 M28 family peptidase [Pseudomonadota bacterium]HCW61275.1 peptidase M28 family protein [Sphingobium sp.]|tara:strand:- start:168 stop:1541 length:1374 start_codon:yes stop_codon:yes gene_type:complete
MQKIRSGTLAALLLGSIFTPSLSLAAPADNDVIREAALKDDVAWDFTEGLTTEVGPRPAGTPQEARARDWAVAKLKALGFSNVRAEPYTMPVWVRGQDEARILSPFPQNLVLAALGNSGSTSDKGIEGEIIYFPSIDALEAASAASLKGKIAFVDHGMGATQDGSSYGYYGAARRQGPSIASKKGAIAILIRSIGTDHHRVPHTGVQMWADGATPIPAAALSVPDAEQLVRVVKRGQPVKVHLTLTSKMLKDQPSGNVVAEIPGSDPAAGVVVAACHLDSWDQGTGAIDDATGCGIAAASALQVAKAGQPRRTIRVLMAGAEEVGGDGARAYFKAHGTERHALAMESDFGADRVWRVDFKLPQGHDDLAKRIAMALAPLGIGAGRQEAGGGADIAPLVKAGVPVIDLQQDGTRYFDLHHTPDDTLDKVDVAQLRQNVAAWAVTLNLVANAAESMSAN